MIYQIDKNELIKRIKKELPKEIDKGAKMEAIALWRQQINEILWDLVKEKK